MLKSVTSEYFFSCLLKLISITYGFESVKLFLLKVLKEATRKNKKGFRVSVLMFTNLKVHEQNKSVKHPKDYASYLSAQVRIRSTHYIAPMNYRINNGHPIIGVTVNSQAFKSFSFGPG